jgi:hypothetical protein
MGKADVFAGQMGLELSANLGWLERFKERTAGISERHRKK